MSHFWGPLYKTFTVTPSQEEKEEDIQSNLKLLQWRETRKSPPKCLECGSEDIKYDSAEQGLSALGVISHDVIYYDFEGNKLKQTKRW